MIKQIYHPYWKWEDFTNGMWRKETKDYENEYLPIAIKFTGDWNRYGAAMIRVINEWPVSCEHNLTDRSQNRRAWIGHAAVCLELGIPEYITRMAWHHLTEEQQVKANRKADIAIELWETTKLKNYAQAEIRF
jgi:hypothetical protein